MARKGLLWNCSNHFNPWFFHLLSFVP
jgi:hypothetical protein